jgi:hypothetical protein
VLYTSGSNHFQIKSSWRVAGNTLQKCFFSEKCGFKYNKVYIMLFDTRQRINSTAGHFKIHASDGAMLDSVDF